MRKYIKASVLLALFRANIAACGEPQGDIYEWASRIVEECPPAENMLHLTYAPGQSVWTPDGRHGVIESLYIGQRGVQRVFFHMDDGEKLNCSRKGIGKDILKYNPVQGKISRSAPSLEE